MGLCKMSFYLLLVVPCCRQVAFAQLSGACCQDDGDVTVTWMMEQSARSAGLLMTRSGEDWLIPQGAVLPFRWTLTGWRDELRGTS